MNEQRSRLRRLRPIALIAVLFVACASLTACWPMSGPKMIHIAATVDDVADMANGAPVEISDITIGQVTGIHLDSTQTKARITMVVKASAKVPKDITVRIRRTTPLGEKFVELLPKPNAGPQLLSNKDRHLTGKAVPDVQDLVQSGTDLFAALSANQISILIDEGAKGFGGKGPELHQLIIDLDNISAGYVTRTGTITNLVNDIKTLTDSLGPNAQANAQLFTNLAQTTQILNDRSNQFLDLLDSVSRLAVETNSLISAHFNSIVLQTHSLQVLTSELASQQDALRNIIKFAPAHNATIMGAIDSKDFAQTLNDFIICGLPGGGEVKGDPVNDCGPYLGGAGYN